MGYEAVSSLEKVRHRIPLLSLDKTKLVSDLVSFVKDHAALLMLKLDGLTKRRGMVYGKTAKTKKAIVQLTEDSKDIEIFAGL